MPPLKEFVEKQKVGFDKKYPHERGLFNTRSGWVIKADPENIKLFLEEIAHSAYLLGITEAEKEIKNYWKFDENQHPISSWHDKQDLLSSLQKLKEGIIQKDKTCCDECIWCECKIPTHQILHRCTNKECRCHKV